MMDIRRTILIYSLGAGLLVAGALFYMIWYGGSHPIPPDSQALTVLDEHIQSMSIEKPFTYTVTSFHPAEDTPLPGVVWCAKIDPPVPFAPVPSNPSTTADRFLIHYTFDGEWSATKFDSRLLYEGFWTQYGCGKW
jgi:hypothetical protein